MHSAILFVAIKVAMAYTNEWFTFGWQILLRFTNKRFRFPLL